MSHLWMIIKSAMTYEKHGVRLVDFEAIELGQKSTFKQKINPLNFPKSQK